MKIFFIGLGLSYVCSYIIQRHLIQHHMEALEHDGTERHHLFIIFLIPYINLFFSIILWIIGMQSSWKHNKNEREGFFRFVDIFYGKKDEIEKPERNESH